MIPGIATVEDLLEPNVVIQFGRPPHRIDFLSAIDGVTFGEAWERRVDEAIVTDDGGRAALPIIGLAELIQNKRASGRHKDLDDVEHLSAARPNR